MLPWVDRQKLECHASNLSLWSLLQSGEIGDATGRFRIGVSRYCLPKTPAARYLQYHYIAANSNPLGKKHLLDAPSDGSIYSRVHARYHPIFRKIIEKFGYYDRFLISPEGTMVYTVLKETDFTTNFTTGP